MRRVVPLLGLLCLSVAGLTACGSDDDKETGSVEVSGAFGQQPTVKITDTPLVRSETESDVVIEGDGPEVAAGDTVFINLYIGDGFNGQKALSSYDKPKDTSTGKDKKSDKAEERPSQQFMLTLLDSQPFPAIRDALDGVKVGSRVEVLSTPEDAFGAQGNPTIGIGNKDTVVFVVDLMSKAYDAPEGATKPLPKGLPSVIEADGKVTGLDFTGTGKPSTKLEVHTLVQGPGAAIKPAGSQVAMRYLGQVWKAKQPFDENYSAAGPGFVSADSGTISAATIPGQLIKGWNEGLVGVKAGSRVMLVVPAKWGYGDTGSGDKIKPGDTLVFVVDILGVG